MMEYIDFTISNKHIVCRRSGVIADNTDYMMRFAFDEGWADYPDKTVLVLDNEDKIWELHLTGGATEIKLPKFIGRKLLAVGVTSTAGDGEISTDAVSLRVNPSIRTGASEVIESPESGAKDMLEEFRQKYDALIAELQAAIDSTYLGVTGAEVGQTVRITEVDEDGNPTGWEAVEFPEQVQSDYEQNDSSAKDYIKNRPFYDSTETTDISGTFVTIAASGSSATHDFIPLQVGQEWKVTTNTGSEFTVVVQENEQGEPCLGSPDTTSGSYPFYIRANEAVCNSSWVLMQNITSLTVTCLSGTYTQIVTKKIDPKFLPDVGSSLVVNLTMDDDGNITADKTFAEIKAASDDGKVVDAKFEDAIVPLQLLVDSEAVFALTNAYSDRVFTASLTCTSDNVWSMSQSGFDAHTLGISGASVGQIVKIKTVDSSGIPTEWEPADMPSGGGGTDTSLGITGATAGQVPVVNSVDENGVPNGWGAGDLPSGGGNSYDIDLSREPDLVIDVSEAINPSLSISVINGVSLDVTKMAVLLEYPSGGNYTPNYIRWNNIIKNAVDTTAILGNFNVANFTDANNAGALLAKIKKINNKTYECEYRWLRQNPGTLTGTANNVCSNIYRNNFDGNTSIKELYIYQAATIPAGSKISIWVGET